MGDLPIGALNLRRRDLTAVLPQLQEAHVLHRTTGHPPGITALLGVLGMAVLKAGRIDAATACLEEALSITSAHRMTFATGVVSMGIAAVSARNGKATTAARLFGAVDTMRTSGQFMMADAFSDGHAAAVADARRALGGAAFETEYRVGQSMRFAGAVSQGQATANHLSRGQASTSPRLLKPAFDLTLRERDVLYHLAAVRSNLEIGQALSIDIRTVETHVLHILAKLDVESRTAAVAVAIRTGLV